MKATFQAAYVLCAAIEFDAFSFDRSPTKSNGSKPKSEQYTSNVSACVKLSGLTRKQLVGEGRHTWCERNCTFRRRRRKTHTVIFL